jgi:PKD repeat protein
MRLIFFKPTLVNPKRHFGLVAILILFASLHGWAQVSEFPFRGGSDNGTWTAVKSNAACSVVSGLRAFSGSAGGGSDYSGIVNSACVVVSTLSPFSGGAEDGLIFSSQINSECTTISAFSPFSGGINDGYAEWRRTNFNCFGPNSTIDSIAPNKVCEGDSIIIAGTYFSNVSSVSFNGTLAQQFTIQDSLTIRATVPTGATSGPVSVNGPEGTAISTMVLNVASLPIAGFTYSTSGGGGLSIDFTNTSSNASSYIWDFGDSFPVSEANPTYTFADEGVYPVTLITRNDCGSDTLTREIEVTKSVSVLDPSNFELRIFPNPFKDNFQLDVKANGSIHVRVFNCLGQQVHSQVFTSSGKTSRIIEIDGLSSGFYIVHVENQHHFGIKRIVKN